MSLLKRHLMPLVLLSSAVMIGCDQEIQSLPKPSTPSITEVHSKNAATPQMTMVSARDLNTVKVKLTSNLKLSGIDAAVKSVQSTEVPGLYYAQVEGIPSFYTGANGKYVLQGSVARLGSAQPVDISLDLRRKTIVNELSSIPLNQSVNFKPEGKPKGLLYVFTDVDCGYCRKLHQEISQITSQGVEVRYLAWPRSEASVPAMKRIWCAKDSKAAMTTAKSGGKLTGTTSCGAPVEQQVALGHEFGVSGTPAIYTVKGENIGGYLPANQLVSQAIEAGSAF